MHTLQKSAILCNLPLSEMVKLTLYMMKFDFREPLEATI